MGAFLDAALGFPAVLFTIFLAPMVLYWFTVLLGVVDVDAAGDGAEIDVGAGDVGDAGDAAEGSGGLLGGLWQAFGLADVPVTLAVSLVVVFGWFVALVATGAADAAEVSTGVRLAVALVAVPLAVVVGLLVAAVVARPLARLFVTTQAESRQRFVGRTCTVRTTTVTGSFGQAEATDPSGATVLLQVRTAEPATEGDLRYGATALIVDYDPAAEEFLVCPVDGVLGDLGGEPGHP